jgi:hypothetical protein
LPGELRSNSNASFCERWLRTLSIMPALIMPTPLPPF